MKNIFDSKDEKLTEKAFIQSVVISVVGILLCIVALCSATFCWFTGGTENHSNTLVSGSFDVTITVVKGNAIGDANGGQGTATAQADTGAAGGTQAEQIEVTAAPDHAGIFICDLPEAGTYTVTLTLKEGSTVKGHCVVTVGNDNDVHTAAIIGENTNNCEDETLTDPFMFTITVTAPTSVRFEPRWGVVVEPQIQQGGTYPTPAETEPEKPDENAGESVDVNGTENNNQTGNNPTQDN